ncbi:unnamed protein product [Paramecium sonneborni]|uniref:Glutamine cyclotransferase n=1 Tax=Paramecium sonneborni TaxID=65129 RepID=A0A8S1LVN9_9CILI|nr:unnamed protein product [Paramecium sonneborni]
MNLQNNRRTYHKKEELNKKTSMLSCFSILAFSLTAFVFIIKGSIDAYEQSNLSKTECPQNYTDLKGTHKLLSRINRDNTKNPQYTQGLLFVNETTLLESSGQYGKSSIHYLNLNDVDNLIFNYELPSNQFGEGCDIINNKVYQLTWLERKINVFNADDLSFITDMKLDDKVAAGWGLTHRVFNGEIQVLITDGSNQVHIADENFIVQQSISIFDDKKKPVTNLNELEYVNGTLFANIYLTSKIVAIDLENQRIIATFDFKDLVKDANRKKRDECLNGIAYNQYSDSFWVTGKNWGFIQEVKLF